MKNIIINKLKLDHRYARYGVENLSDLVTLYEMYCEDVDPIKFIYAISDIAESPSEVDDENKMHAHEISRLVKNSGSHSIVELVSICFKDFADKNYDHCLYPEIESAKRRSGDLISVVRKFDYLNPCGLSFFGLIGYNLSIGVQSEYQKALLLETAAEELQSMFYLKRLGNGQLFDYNPFTSNNAYYFFSELIALSDNKKLSSIVVSLLLKSYSKVTSTSNKLQVNCVENQLLDHSLLPCPLQLIMEQSSQELFDAYVAGLKALTEDERDMHISNVKSNWNKLKAESNISPSGNAFSWLDSFIKSKGLSNIKPIEMIDSYAFEVDDKLLSVLLKKGYKSYIDDWKFSSKGLTLQNLLKIKICEDMVYHKIFASSALAMKSLKTLERNEEFVMDTALVSSYFTDPNNHEAINYVENNRIIFFYAKNLKLALELNMALNSMSSLTTSILTSGAPCAGLDGLGPAEMLEMITSAGDILTPMINCIIESKVHIDVALQEKVKKHYGRKLVRNFEDNQFHLQ